MKSGTMLVVLACVAVAGCSLQDLLKKLDDADAAATSADSGTSASAAVDAAPVAAAVSDAGPVAKNGPSPATAKPKSNIPVCPKGKVLGTEALSPFKPVCGAPCKTDADCTGNVCTSVNALAPDGSGAKTGPQFIKICDPDTVLEKAAPGTKPTASASAGAASAKKDDCGCGSGQVLFTSADTVTCAVLPCRGPGGSCKKEDKTVGTCMELGTGETGQRVRCGHLIQCQ